MLAPGFTFDVIKVTDFGIAKMAEEELAAAAEGGEESITGSQTMMGALPYMSPEMIKTPRSTGTAADVWAIGAICYELVTGTKPFGTGLLAVPKVLQGAFDPLPSSLRKAQFGGLLTELFDLMQRCMVVDPDARISADALVQECGKLCYPAAERRKGVVTGMPYGSWGFIDTVDGYVFFHVDSVYGPPVAVGDEVCFADFPGDPQPRAHPVIKLV
jgi:serine/threonine protein kinase